VKQLYESLAAMEKIIRLIDEGKPINFEKVIKAMAQTNIRILRALIAPMEAAARRDAADAIKKAAGGGKEDPLKGISDIFGGMFK
jgi:hypothetical protein